MPVSNTTNTLFFFQLTNDLELFFQMLDLSHENINPFLGIVLNPQSQNFIIFQYCPKGSLQVNVILLTYFLI